jgi:site-specific recombinase XerC
MVHGRAGPAGFGAIIPQPQDLRDQDVFAYLVQAGYLKQDPAKPLIPPTIPHKERRFLSEEEYQALLSPVSSVRDRAMLELFLQTGLRLSELARLSVDDLELPRRISKDPENVGFLKVRRKGTMVESASMTRNPDPMRE